MIQSLACTEGVEWQEEDRRGCRMGLNEIHYAHVKFSANILKLKIGIH